LIINGFSPEFLPKFKSRRGLVVKNPVLTGSAILKVAKLRNTKAWIIYEWGPEGQIHG
jgi:hypothetical protein